MKLNYINDVVFNGSTRPGIVVLNGTSMSFETDDEAKFVFDLLNKQRDACQAVKTVMMRMTTDLCSIAEDFSHYPLE